MTTKVEKLRKIADERDKQFAIANSAQVRIAELNRKRENIIMED